MTSHRGQKGASRCDALSTHAHLLQHADSCRRAVENVEVDSRHAAIEEFLHLTGCKVDANFKLRCLILASSFEGPRE